MESAGQGKHKSIANCAGTGRGPEQGQDENQAKFKMGVGMKIMSSADNTSNKNFTTMTVKDIRGHLDKIPVTGFDVMCGCSVQEGETRVQKEVDEELRGQHRSDRERDERAEENSEHKTSESRTSSVYQTVVIANITGQLRVTFEYVQ